MDTVSKGVLKAKLLEYLRRVEKTGEELIITDNKKPVLKIVLINQSKSPDEVFGPAQGKVKYKEDILTPTEEEWNEK